MDEEQNLEKEEKKIEEEFFEDCRTNQEEVEEEEKDSLELDRSDSSIEDDLEEK